MRLDDRVEIEVEKHVGAHHHDIGERGALEQNPVGDDIAEQEAHAAFRGAVRIAGDHEQAALFAVKLPVLA